MCQENYNIKQRKFKQLTYQDRIKIEVLYNKQHLNYTEIAKILEKHRTTISREIKNNLVKNLTTELVEIYVYSAEIGQNRNILNETAKGTNLKIGNDIKLADFIEKEIKEEKQKEEADRIKPNKEGKTIHDRPREIDKREEVGYWEMDLVEGLKGQKEPYLLVLSERKTRKEIIELIPNKSAESVGKALDRIERQLGVVKFRETFKTITTDNGAEFRNWKVIEKSYTGSKKARTTQYFVDAYSSWQRGTNENINKMIRRFLPKKTSFKNLKQEDVKRIEKWINNYPRKIFNFKTSEDYYKEEMLSA